MQYCQNSCPRAKREGMNLMTRLYNMIAICRNADASDGCICNNLSDTSGEFPLSIFKMYKHISNLIYFLTSKSVMCFFVFLKKPMTFDYCVTVFKIILT